MEHSNDPAREYDLHVAEQERRYAELIANATCGDCSNCVKPDESHWSNPERIGYCGVNGEFVCLDEEPKELDCEEYE